MTEVRAEPEERGHIRVKGIAYPIAVYDAVAPKTELAATWNPVRADMPHLRLELQPELMSDEERDLATTALRQALGILESQAPKHDLSSPTPYVASGDGPSPATNRSETEFRQ